MSCPRRNGFPRKPRLQHVLRHKFYPTRWGKHQKIFDLRWSTSSRNLEIFAAEPVRIQPDTHFSEEESEFRTQQVVLLSPNQEPRNHFAPGSYMGQR